MEILSQLKTQIEFVFAIEITSKLQEATCVIQIYPWWIILNLYIAIWGEIQFFTTNTSLS